jgi:hypothetical protein
MSLNTKLEKMMDKVILKNQTPKGEMLEATFIPDKGMNMISYKKGDIEVIDQSTRSLFEERFAGLGAMIGPHFHHRRPEIIPKIPDESLFPHIARVKAKGIQEPFSHGIGRYAPWKAEVSPTGIKAHLSGKDTWNGVPLATLEGQNFIMEFDVELTPTGLNLSLSVVSDADSLVGIHYYYHLPQGKGKVISEIQNIYIDQNQRKTIPASWSFNDQHLLTFDLDKPADYTFFPFPNPREGSIKLDSGAYQLLTTYSCQSQENSWQLYHPEGASFVCIEPLSSQDPSHPNLTVSSIHIRLQIL